MCRVAVERQLAATIDVWLVPDTGVGPLEDRVARLVEQRLTLHDAVSSVWRVGQMRAPFEPVLAESLERTAALNVEQMRRHFATELDGLASDRADLVAESLAAVCSIDAVDLLRHVRGLDRATTAEILSAVLSSMLSAELSAALAQA